MDIITFTNKVNAIIKKQIPLDYQPTQISHNMDIFHLGSDEHRDLLSTLSPDTRTVLVQTDVLYSQTN